MMTSEKINMNEKAVAIREFVKEYPIYGQGLIDHCNNNLNEAKRLASEYQGMFRDLGEYAQWHYELDDADLAKIPDIVTCNIDWGEIGITMKRKGIILVIIEKSPIQAYEKGWKPDILHIFDNE